MTAPKLDAQDRVRLCDMVRNRRYTVREAAMHFGVSPRTAHRVLAAAPPTRADVAREAAMTLMRAAVREPTDEALQLVEDALDEYFTERSKASS